MQAGAALSIAWSCAAWAQQRPTVSAVQGPAASTAGASQGQPLGKPLGVHGAAPGETRRVRGRLLRAAGAAPAPLSSRWVVLHRVGSDRAGPLDSVRSDAAGAYAFQYKTSGDPRAVYFVSSSYAGIAYFTAPLQSAEVAGEAAELTVYDTTSAPVPIRVRARHIVVSAPDTAKTRTVIEVFELSNDSTVTRVAAADTGAVWQSALIDGASHGQVGRTDFSEDAVKFPPGAVRLFAPFSPGLKQFSFSYDVPLAEEYRVPVLAAADLVEVLVEDPLGRATGGGLAPKGPANVGGRTFARFLAQDVPAAAVITVSAASRGPASDGQWRMLAIIAALGAVLLVGLARTMMRRSSGARRRATAADAATLRQQLAALDESFAKITTPTEAQRADHWQQRALLSKQISDAVAREQGLG